MNGDQDAQRDPGPSGAPVGGSARGGKPARPAMLLLAALAVSATAVLSLRHVGNGGPETKGAEVAAATSQSATQAGKENPGPSVEALRGALQLAKSREFFLFLDPRSGELTLRLRGAVVHTWPVARTEQGHRRLLFVELDPPRPLSGTTWTSGRLDPARNRQRPVIEVDSQGNLDGPEPPAVPPTPEEALPAPDSYLIRFAEGLTIEVIAGADQASVENAGVDQAGAEEGPSAVTSGHASFVAPGRLVRDALEAVSAGRDGGPRLRLIIPQDEAGALYRSFRDGTPLVIG